MNITILSVQTVNTVSKAGKPLQQLEVAYKNNTFGGKVESKKLFGFGANAPAFDALKGAQTGSTYEVEVTKNAAGYNDWTAVKPAAAAQGASTTTTQTNTGNSVSVKSTYETPEERAKKQVYIIRQSSVSSAINNLSVGAKSPPAPDAILALASIIYDWVMQDPEKQAASDLMSMPNDFPDIE